MTIIRKALIEQFQEKCRALFAESTSTLEEFQRQSFEKLAKAKPPSNKSEAWKYINIQDLLNTIVQTTATTSSQENPSILTGDADILLLNGRLKNINPDLSKEIICCNLSQAVNNHEKLLRLHLGKLQKEEIFSLVNSALLKDILLIVIPEGHKLSAPLNISLCSTSNAISNPRLLVLCDSGSHSQINLKYISEDLIPPHDHSPAPHFSNSLSEIYLGKDSHLTLSRFSEHSHKSVSLSEVNIAIRENAQFHSHNFTLGYSGIYKQNISLDFLGENSQAYLNGLYLSQGSASIHNQLQVNHQVSNCYSEQLYKGILLDQSQAEFTGAINISPDTSGSEACQLNRNLSLSDEAIAHSRPQLQILADDVKCSHGSSTGQIDKEQIFYLKNRGLSLSQARQLLLNAFTDEMTDKIKDIEIKAKFEQSLAQIFQEAQAIV